MKLRALPLFLSLLAAACNADDTASQPSPPITTEAGVPAPAAPRRTVGHRNPFGDSFQADNLMVDGDFELTGRSDQAPWLAFDPTKGQITLDYDTGGHCRSGVRCATISGTTALVGLMSSPLVAKMEVKAYAKVSSGRCADLQVLVFDLRTNAADVAINATTVGPADDGWCVFAGEADNLAYTEPGLYVELGQKPGVTATVDEVSVLPAGEAPVHGSLPPLTPVPAATRARAAHAATWIRAHRRYGRGRVAGPP